MTRISSTDINYLLDFNPRFVEFLEFEKASVSVKVSLLDVTVLPNALEARLKLSLSGNPRNTIIGSYLTRNGVGTNEGTNYVRTTGKFIFHPGEGTEQEIVIPLKGNNAPGKTVEVVLSSTISGASIAKNIGTIIFSSSIPSGVKSGFTLVHEENFIDNFYATDTGLLPDGTPCWQSRPHHGRMQDGNKELGLYVDPELFPGTDPFPIVNGKRVLRSEKLVTPIKYPDDYRSWNYTASMITSRKSRTLTVGDRVEARFAMPCLGDRGGWPAFWLMPTNGNWPPEIDMMEWPINNIHNAWTYYTTQHWTSTSGGHLHLSYPVDIRTLGITEDLTGYHTYGVEITSKSLIFDIDGKKTVEMENRSPTASWYVLLNMAFGGTWAGNPTVDTTHPIDMVLDWIRFYKPAV
ncbi:beta-glucanase [Sinorhizobium phage phiN3]|uniref:Beta-glucanase n=1 Tax=Sinorhizobium phage phiN3 TaxID=1647405 RepID=A0A0F6WCT5_9CAUD|nr:beta-glucanase [Sinorhizobium phage phiN3]AKF13399.1 beta-glucanase [Sinorhizobium phage phiN3]